MALHPRYRVWLPLLLAAMIVKGGEAQGSRKRHTEVGLATYYGKEFKRARTASGEKYNPHKYTAAHRTLPFGTKVRVTRLDNGKSVVVRINDRGPFVKGRIIDLSWAAAKKLGILNKGTVKVRIKVVKHPW